MKRVLVLLSCVSLLFCVYLPQVKSASSRRSSVTISRRSDVPPDEWDEADYVSNSSSDLTPKPHEIRSSVDPTVQEDSKVITGNAANDLGDADDALMSVLWICVFAIVPLLVVVIAVYWAIRCYSSRVGSTRASSVVYKAGSEPPKTPPTACANSLNEEPGIATISVPYAYSSSASPYGNPTTEPL